MFQLYFQKNLPIQIDPNITLSGRTQNFINKTFLFFTTFQHKYTELTYTYTYFKEFLK